MVKRTKTRRRRSRKKKHLARRKKSHMTKWGLAKYNIHSYRRYGRGYTMNLTSNPTGFDTTAFQFSFDRVTNYTELTTIYDQYVIDFVQIRILWSPKTTLGANVNAPGQSTYPVLYYFKDYDDATVPTSLSEMKERGNLRQVRINPNGLIKINLKPAVLSTSYLTALTSGYAPKWGQKVDMNYPTVPHYGLKIGIDHLDNQDQGALDIEIVYHVTCFGTK